MTKTAQPTTKSAEAGRRGDDVRSDCWARITLADTGGIEIDHQRSPGYRAAYGKTLEEAGGDVPETLTFEISIRVGEVAVWIRVALTHTRSLDKPDNANRDC